MFKTRIGYLIFFVYNCYFNVSKILNEYFVDSESYEISLYREHNTLRHVTLIVQ